MENSDLKQNVSGESPELKLTNESLSYLNETRKWTMFFSVLGFIGIGLLVLFAFIMLIIGIAGGNWIGGYNSSFFTFFSAFYIILGALYFIPVLYLLRFSNFMKSAVEQKSQENLSAAFMNLKSHYRFLGIFTIVMFGVYIIGGIVFAIVGLASIF